LKEQDLTLKYILKIAEHVEIMATYFIDSIIDFVLY